MILYHAITAYHLLEFMVHKFVKHKNDKAILLIPEFLRDNYKNYEELVHKEMFNRVLIIRYREIINDESNIFNQMKEIIESDLNIDISRFEEIYVAGAQYYFSIYLIEKRRTFTFFEEGSGMISRPEILEKIVMGLNSTQHKIAKNNGLYTGANMYIHKRVCNICSQIEEYKCNYANYVENFDVVKALINLERSEQRKIVTFFTDIDMLIGDNNATVFLTQHFAHLGVMTFEEQKRIHQLYVDYYLSSQPLIIKKHPDDLMYYSQLFKDAKVIKERFPSEFLPILFKNKPRTIATITSTAINNLKDFFENNIALDKEFEQQYEKTHAYLCILTLTAMISKKVYVDSNCVNTIKYLAVQNRLNIEVESYDIHTENSLHNNGFFLFDADRYTQSFGEIEEWIYNNINERDVIIYCNEMNYEAFPIKSKQIHSYVIPIEITRKSNDSYKKEMVFVISKKMEVREMAEKFTYRKDLHNCQEIVEVKNFSEEQQKIKILEGILKATEKRLKYYIKLCKDNNITD